MLKFPFLILSGTDMIIKNGNYLVQMWGGVEKIKYRLTFLWAIKRSTNFGDIHMANANGWIVPLFNLNFTIVPNSSLGFWHLLNTLKPFYCTVISLTVESSSTQHTTTTTSWPWRLFWKALPAVRLTMEAVPAVIASTWEWISCFDSSILFLRQAWDALNTRINTNEIALVLVASH